MPVATFDVAAQLVLNNDKKTNHAAHLEALLESAVSFDCISAFASASGLDLIYDVLLKRLKKGLSARFVLGLDFYQTEPDVLYDLLSLAEDYPELELYISNTNARTVLHPKLYAFEDQSGNSFAMLGSANFTRGGLATNHELSALLCAEGRDLYQHVSEVLDQLIWSNQVVEATEDLIDTYAIQHREHSFYQAVGRKRAQLSVSVTEQSLDKLQTILELMKQEPAYANPQLSVFTEQVQQRNTRRRAARAQLEKIAAAGTLTPATFSKHYDLLVTPPYHWSSSGLHRNRASVAQRATVFQKALQMIEKAIALRPEEFLPEVVFGPLLEKFKEIPHAGINVLTEVLHTYDRDHFAIMNRNSVSGFTLANITGFPLSPSKTNLSPAQYVRFCKKGREICEALGLNDFTELDALLNYAYWN